MKILLIYKSKTGFTKSYAELIAKETGCTLLEFQKASSDIMSGYDVIVYGAGLRAGFVDGLKKAKKMYEASGAKTFVLFATGATPNAASDVIEAAWKNNLSPEELANLPHFYMQSGICYERMNFPDKLLMKIAAAMMSKKEDKSDIDAGFEQALAGSFDISSDEYAKPLIDYLRSL